LKVEGGILVTQPGKAFNAQMWDGKANDGGGTQKPAGWMLGKITQAHGCKIEGHAKLGRWWGRAT